MCMISIGEHSCLALGCNSIHWSKLRNRAVSGLDLSRHHESVVARREKGRRGGGKEGVKGKVRQGVREGNKGKGSEEEGGRKREAVEKEGGREGGREKEKGRASGASLHVLFVSMVTGVFAR